MTALVQPTLANVPWSFESPNTFFHYYQHPTRDSGGNPVIIYLHGGGGRQNDARILTHGGSRPQCVVFETLREATGAGVPHFDFIGLNQDQWSTYKPHPKSAEGSSWKTGGYLNGDTGVIEGAPTYPDAAHPNGKDVIGVGNVNEAAWKLGIPYNIGRYGQAHVINATKRAIISIKSMAARYGGVLDIDPNKVFLLGTSYGGWQAMASQAQPPLVVPRQAALQGTEYFHMEPGTTSQVRGIINWYGHPDVRQGSQQILDFGGDANTEVLPQIIFETFQARIVADQNPSNKLKEKFSPQWFMETGQTEWLPPIVHFMFAPRENAYPLDAPFHQSDLGFNAVRYGGSEFKTGELEGISRTFRKQEMFEIAQGTFGPAAAEGKRMKAILLAWAQNCMS